MAALRASSSAAASSHPRRSKATLSPLPTNSDSSNGRASTRSRSAGTSGRRRYERASVVARDSSEDEDEDDEDDVVLQNSKAAGKRRQDSNARETRAKPHDRLPPTLVQTARDIVGAHLTTEQVQNAWNLCSKVNDPEARRTAAIEMLLAIHGFEKKTGTSKSTSRDKQKKAHSASSSSNDKRERSIIELDPDSSDSDIRIVGSTRATPARNSKTSAKRRGEDVPFGSHKRVRTSESLAEDGDEPDPASHAVQAQQPKEKGKEGPSSGESSGSDREVGKEQTPSTAPTSAGQSSASGSDKKGDHARDEQREEPVSNLALVLAMVPDVDPAHAERLLAKYADQPDTVAFVIDDLFGSTTYPKAPQQSTGVAGRSRAAASDTRVERDYYTWKDRKPADVTHYFLAANAYLNIDFPTVPLPYVRTTLHNEKFYALAHKKLSEEQALADSASCKWIPLKNPRKDKGKGTDYSSQEVDEERKWVLERRARETAEAERQALEEAREKEEEAAGHVFECGCCFGDYIFSKMVQCPEAHLFCMDCARKNAENILGNQQTELQCMDQDGCTATFTASECARFLKQAQLDLLEKLRSAKAVDQAEIDGLAKCPHCPWACVIENPDEKLFHCQNEVCRKVTCRKCQKSNHLPKSCEEYAEDLKTNNIHRVEEAMTEALLRKCPKCQTAILKEYGCNKMTCTTCRTLFCFVCKVAIAGYQHFQGQGGAAASGSKDAKCPLWDDTATRQYNEVEEARKAAVEELKKNQDAQVADEDLDKLNIDKPPPQDPRLPPNPNIAQQQQPWLAFPGGFAAWNAYMHQAAAGGGWVPRPQQAYVPNGAGGQAAQVPLAPPPAPAAPRHPAAVRPAAPAPAPAPAPAAGRQQRRRHVRKR